MSDISKNLFEGIQLIVHNIVNNAGYDKTYMGVVVGTNDDGYIVTINGLTYNSTPYMYYNEISIGDIVYVLFPLNNPKNRVILGVAKA